MSNSEDYKEGRISAFKDIKVILAEAGGHTNELNVYEAGWDDAICEVEEQINTIIDLEEYNLDE